MRRLAPVLAVFFVWAAPAHANTIVNVQVSSTLGAAPLTVTLTAGGDAAAYHWCCTSAPSATAWSPKSQW